MQSPQVNLVIFTGSTEVGIATALSAAKNLTHVALELGGDDASVVLKDADVALVATEVPWGGNVQRRSGVLREQTLPRCPLPRSRTMR